MLKFILLLIVSSTVSAQDSHDEIIQRFLEQRKKMMEEMMRAFGDDDFFSDDFDDDKVFEALKNNGIGGFGQFKSMGQNVTVEEKMQNDGSIDVIITPKSENVDLNIETKDNRIVIKSETRVEENNESQSGTSKVFSSSSFSRSVSIPDGYEAQTPKQKDKSIIITLKPSSENMLKKSKDGKTPIKRRKGEKVI